MHIEKEAFKWLWDAECRHWQLTQSNWSHRTFRSVFGVWDHGASCVWQVLDEPANKKLHKLAGWKPKDLPNAPHFIKCYGTESDNATFCNRNEKTLRMWNWCTATAIASQDWVRTTNVVVLR